MKYILWLYVHFAHICASPLVQFSDCRRPVQRASLIHHSSSQVSRICLIENFQTRTLQTGLNFVHAWFCTTISEGPWTKNDHCCLVNCSGVITTTIALLYLSVQQWENLSQTLYISLTFSPCKCVGYCHPKIGSLVLVCTRRSALGLIMHHYGWVRLVRDHKND